MPATRQDLFERLASLEIVTQTSDHSPVFTVEEAKLVHGEIEGGHCKNLFCKDEKGILWLLVALEDTRIDLKAIKDRIGSKRLTFGRPELLMEVLGLEPGSVSPFGLINDLEQRTNVILDETMMRMEKLNFHPLQNNATTTISSTDLVKFIAAMGHSPRIVSLGEQS